MMSLLIVTTVFGCTSSPLAPESAVVTQIVVTPDMVTSEAGRAARFTTLSLDADGNPVPGAEVEWTSADPSIAVVDSDGTVWSFSSGTTGVEAKSKGNGKANAPGQVKKAAAVTVQTATQVRPDRVTDLAIESVTTSRINLVFTEVDDGTGQPSNYLFRFQIAPLSWSQAANVTFGSCGGQLSGIEIGNRRVCSVSNLAEGTNYQFQVIAFRGSITQDPIYSDLSNIVGGSTAAAEQPAPEGSSSAWFVEDYSSYFTIEQYLQKTSDGRYRTGGSNPQRMVLDDANGFGTSPRSLRYDFPNRSGHTNRCHDFSIGRDLYFPETVTEVWVEAWIRFTDNFHTRAPTEWNCTSNPDFKLLFGLIWPDGHGRFQVKVGTFGHSWATSAPGVEGVSLGLASEPYWDGAWHQVRTHWKTGSGDGALELWVDGELIYSNTALSPDATGIWGLKLGANMNQGPAEAMSYWWGRTTVWRERPAWGQ